MYYIEQCCQDTSRGLAAMRGSENSLYGNRLAWCKIVSKATTQVCSYSKKASAKLEMKCAMRLPSAGSNVDEPHGSLFMYFRIFAPLADDHVIASHVTSVTRPIPTFSDQLRSFPLICDDFRSFPMIFSDFR
jgi:hypothetical protein